VSEHPAFTCTIEWSGDMPAADLATYGRNYTIVSDAHSAIEGSAPAAYGGAADRYNPEELMLASLSSCHLLTFLAVASRAKVRITGYRAQGHGQLAMKDGKVRFVNATLTPQVTVALAEDLSKLPALHQKAHANCFMSNSVNFPVAVEATGEVSE
jgi:organic hydroperoxide reductase OsmC/OhrA